MSRVFSEQYDPSKHRNHMLEVDSVRDEHGYVIVLESTPFRLEFLSLDQIDEAIAYFSKPNISTRTSRLDGDHWEFQSWISRLPAGINNAKNRVRMLKLLEEAKETFSNNPTYKPVSG